MDAMTFLIKITFSLLGRIIQGAVITIWKFSKAARNDEKFERNHQRSSFISFYCVALVVDVVVVF